MDTASTRSDKKQHEGTQIVRATEKDLDTVWGLIEKDANWLSKEKGFSHWSSYYTKDVMKKKLLSEEVFLINNDRKVVGTVTLDQRPVEYYITTEISSFKDRQASALYISALAVDPDLHGQGIASDLLLFAEEESKKRKIKYIRFDCRAEYQELVHFYEKRGYGRVGAVSEGEGENYLLMEKKIEYER